MVIVLAAFEQPPEVVITADVLAFEVAVTLKLLPNTALAGTPVILVFGIASAADVVCTALALLKLLFAGQFAVSVHTPAPLVIAIVSPAAEQAPAAVIEAVVPSLVVAVTLNLLP